MSTVLPKMLVLKTQKRYLVSHQDPNLPKKGKKRKAKKRKPYFIVKMKNVSQPNYMDPWPLPLPENKGPEPLFGNH